VFTAPPVQTTAASLAEFWNLADHLDGPLARFIDGQHQLLSATCDVDLSYDPGETLLRCFLGGREGTVALTDRVQVVACPDESPQPACVRFVPRRPFPPDVILLAVRWYLRYGLSYRDVEELLAERVGAGNAVAVV
jgi:hypothetical protein